MTQLTSNGLDPHGFVAPVLPLGISFFTFTQIAFLVDCYQRRAAERNFSSYFLFVTYFPHLIAGPVLHHKEMMPQFNAKRTSFVDAEGIAVGLTMFAIGLFKKVVLADSVASYANQGFGAAASGVTLMPLEAWAAALSYTFQLYFDFSGYSDMAIGLSRMFGIRLPLNFDSPYKATSIADFWRRWHMTLSRFLRDYLYIPLGGNRNGPARRYVNLLTTMVLGGLWHGAGWTFIVWGALHGIFLCINQGWVAFRSGFVLPGVLAPLERALAWMLTFLAVVVAWVFFRADNLATALAVCSAMFSGMPEVAELVYALSHPAQRIQGLATNLGGLDLLRLLALLGIAVLLPNSQQWLDRFRPALEQAAHVPMKKLQWVPHWALGAAMGLLAGVAVSLISSNSAFLYFNF